MKGRCPTVKTKRWLSLLTAAVLLAGAAAGPVVRGEEAAGEAAGDIAATGEPVSISFDYPSEEAMLADMSCTLGWCGALIGSCGNTPKT